MLRSAGISSAVLVLSLAAVAFGFEDLRMHGSCRHCGMDREAFGYSRMLIEYTDGTSAGTCSLHCTVLELTMNISKVPCSIRVGDYDSRTLIDAFNAYWVVGGSRQGVMTQRAKWAFEKESAAKEFTGGHGGKIVSFYDALEAAYEDVYEEVKMTLKRTKMRMMQGWDMCSRP